MKNLQLSIPLYPTFLNASLELPFFPPIPSGQALVARLPCKSDHEILIPGRLPFSETRGILWQE